MKITQSILLLLLPALPLSAQTVTIRTLVDSGRTEFNSQAVVNGKPAIGYYDRISGQLKYTLANDAIGTSWSTPITVDSDGNVGVELSMAVVNGNPAIAYRDFTDLNLKYVRALDPDGTTWGKPITVDDDAGNVGAAPSLAVVNGNPAICHYDFRDQLKYVRASDATGASWNPPVIVVSSEAGYRSSLKEVNGNPAIAYYTSFPGPKLQYLRATDENGMNWNAPVTVHSDGTVVGYPRLEVVNGNPAIGYNDYTNDDLKYVRASDANGTTWNTPIGVDSPGDEVGEFTSLAMVNGKPAIAYANLVTPRSLKYVAASDADGANWETPVTVDSSSSPLYFISLVAIAGNPAISYVIPGVNSNNLKWASILPGTPAQVGNISTRLAVGTGDNALIGGFIITGTQPKRVIIRAIGPSLPLSGVLADPILEFHGSDGSAITNDNWRATQESEIIAAGVQPSNDLESAIVVTLPPGGHTAIVRGTNNTTGVGLVEVYDLDAAAESRMANVSTRGFVQIGDNVLIGGTIITGTGSANLLVRGIGPSLTSLGVSNALGDPTLELRDGSGALVASNDHWQDTQQAEIQATGLAPTNNLECAILQNLTPGGYTAIVRGNNDTTGVALVEVYSLQ